MEIIDQYWDVATASELGESLSAVEDGRVVYVVGPDGSRIDGFKVVEELLSDGSKVRTVILVAQPLPPRAALAC